MNEPYYSYICWAIRLCPILFMGIVWLFGYYRSWEDRKAFLTTIAVGYVVGVASVWAYWDYAGNFAPNATIADEILEKDGAPRVLAPIVMPILVGIYFVLMWPFTWSVTKVWPRKNAVTPATNQDVVMLENAGQE